MVTTTNLKTYEPFADMFRANPFLDVTGLFDLPRLRRAVSAMPPAPEIRMDVTETPDAYHVKAEIPGVKKEDIHIVIEGNTVSISVQVEQKSETREGETALCTELYRGSMARTFTLLADVDDALSQAKYENGMLELTLPKKANAKSKTLTVA
ncbi:MAG: Hsp20/alpha crystallin family protein [Burkholderiales bacterium]